MADVDRDAGSLTLDETADLPHGAHAVLAAGYRDEDPVAVFYYLVIGYPNGFLSKFIFTKSLNWNNLDDVEKAGVKEALAESGIILATAEDIKTSITERADKRMATQVYASLSCGATRMEEKKVVSVLCKE